MYIDSSKIRINQPGRAARLMARTLTASSTEVLAGLVDRVTVAERLFGCRIIYSDAAGLPDPSEGILHFSAAVRGSSIGPDTSAFWSKQEQRRAGELGAAAPRGGVAELGGL